MAGWVEPHPDVEGAAERRRARLNASFLLGLFTTGTTMTLLFFAMDAESGLGSSASESIITLGSLVGLLIGYFFALSRRPAAGGTLLVVVPLVAIWALWARGNEGDAILYFLALPLMLAPFSISWRSTLAIFSANLLALVVVTPLWELYRGIPIDAENHVVLASFIGIVSVLALTAARAMTTEMTTVERSETDLRAANEKLKELDRSRLQFVNNLAHDLASPIYPVRLQLAILEALPEITPDQKKKSLGIMKRNVDQFERLLGDFRDVAKIEGGRLQLQVKEVDVASIVHQSCEGFSGSATQRGLTLECRAPAPLVCLADGQRITQVVYNLITNALKFTPSGGHVKVTALAAGGTAEVRVTDSGRGLTTDERARLFQPFSQVHDATQFKERGTGLGLFICKGLITAHGGTIGVFSDGLGKGSTFWFTLPLKPASAPS